MAPQSDLTTEEAKSRNLPGSDTFKNTHIWYHDSLHRDWGVVFLLRESLKAFVDTILISHHQEMKTEDVALQEFVTSGRFNTTQPLPPAPKTHKYFESLNYEHLKIACGFEMALKAMLLQHDYVLHKVEDIGAYKVLSQKQKKQPILKTEILAINNFRFNGHINYLPGISKQSLGFASLLEQGHYRTALGLNDEVLDIINEFRDLRNQIHLPGDILDTPKLRSHPKGKRNFILEFINTVIIENSNQLVQKHEFNWRLLAPLE
jgi:hypothetical protein